MTEQEIAEAERRLQQEKQVAQLTAFVNTLPESKRVEVLARYVGYKKMPPDIETILYDDYYLGHVGKSLYPCWQEWLKEFFYNPIQSQSTIVTLSGALGIGKSYVSMMILLVDLIRLSLHPDPFSFLGLNKLSTPFSLRFFNKDKAKAQMVLVEPFVRIVEECPYLIERRRNTGEFYPHHIQFGTAKQSLDIISEALVGIILSEFNFVKQRIAEDMLTTSLNRMRGRLLKSLSFHLWTHVIIDSSASQENSALNNFIRENAWEKDTVSVLKSIWEAKAHLGMFFEHGSFEVYLGDASKGPFILPPPEVYNRQLNSIDEDRILTVPAELRPDFEMDMIKALQDLAGVSTSTENKFFTDRAKLTNAFSLHTPIDDVHEFYFNDTTSIWEKLGNQILAVLPKDKWLYIRIDLATKNDNAGFAIVYGDWAEYKKVGDEKTGKQRKIFVGHYKCPVVFALTRPKGDETNIDKIFEFVMEIAQRRQVKLVTTDQFQSTDFRQRLMLNDVPAELLSVDRTAEPYFTGKQLVMQGQVQIADNKLTMKECRELLYINDKVNHPAGGCFRGDTQVRVKDKLTDIVSSMSLLDLIDGKAYLGYQVYSYNEISKSYEFVDIKKVFKTKEVTELVRLEFDNQVFYCTPEHLVLTTKGYVPAKELTTDSDILCVYE